MKGTLYALTRNKNDIDSKEKLDSMLQKVDATGAAFINGKNILADSIFARQISAQAITTEHMAANTIKGDRIEAGTLNADRIMANTIVSSMISTQGLSADVIKAGTISAGNGVSVLNMTNGEFSFGNGKLGYVAATDRLYIGANSLYLGSLPIEEHNRMVGGQEAAASQKAAIESEKKATDARYTATYNNTNLITGAAKTDLYNKYNDGATGYVFCYDAVVTALTAVQNASFSLSIAQFAALKTTAGNATTAYATAMGLLTTSLDTAEKQIANKVSTNAATTASDAAIITARLVSLKAAMLGEKNVFVSQKNDTDSQYFSSRTKMTDLTLTTEKTALETAYGTVSTRYLQKYNTLITALDAIINAVDTTTTAALDALDATVSSAVTAYTSELALLSTALSVAEQAISTKLANNALGSANQNTTNQIALAVPYNAVFTNENQSIITDVNGATKAVFVIATDIDAFRGSTRVAATIGTVTLKTTAGAAITYTGGTPTITKSDPTASVKGWVSVSIPSGCTLSADVGYVDIPITMNSILYARKITWNKAKDGLNAKTISIGGAQTFSYDEYGVLKYPASTTLSVAKQNTVGSAYTWTYGINGAEPVTALNGVAGQVVFAGDTVQIFPTAAIWGTADNLTIKATLEGASDTMTLYKIRDGVSGTNLVLETPDGISFKDNSGSAKALNVKLIRNGDDVSGNATIRWYLNGVENVGLLNLTSMNIYPADVTSSLVIRIVATYLGTDYENSAVFVDLDDTYQVQIIGEDKIKNSQGNVTLTARVFRGANEITTGYRLRWTDVGQVPAVVLLEGSNTVDDRALTCVLTPAKINGSIDILCELSVDTVEAELEGIETTYVPSYDSRAYATAMSVALS